MSASPRRFIVSIMNPGESPADNGRTVHALKLAKELKDGGAEVIVLFEGQGVQWIPRFTNRTEDSHPFDRHYGPVFDEIRPLVRACNMCCIRFNATEAVKTAEIPIMGEGRDHASIGPLLLDGWQVVHF